MTKKGVSAEECAKDCAADEKNGCYNFEFCESLAEVGKKPDRVCRFGTGKAAPSIVHDKKCKLFSIKSKILRAVKPSLKTLYKTKSNPEDTKSTLEDTKSTTEATKPAPEETKSTTDNTQKRGGVTPTVTVFFALFFVALGAIGGVFAFRYYEKWRAERGT